jgi:hypothetical protein
MKRRARRIITKTRHNDLKRTENDLTSRLNLYRKFEHANQHLVFHGHTAKKEGGMKRNYGFWAVLLAIFLVASTVQAEIAIHRLGVHPFWKPPLKSVMEMRTMIQKSLPDLQKGFELAHASELFDVFVDNSKSATPQEVLIQPGSKLEWMIFKNGKNVKVIRDAVWKGKAPFKAYRFSIEKQGKRYDFIIPLDCGNVSLEQITVLPPPPAPAKAPAPPAPAPPANQPPSCHVTVSPETAFTGEAIVVDASQSLDADGSVASMLIQVKDAGNQVVKEVRVDKAPFVQSITMDKAGTYTVQVTVTDNKGASSSAPGCAAKTIQIHARGKITTDAGVLYQNDPATFLLMRIGYEYRFNNWFSMLGMIGVAPVVHGDDDTTSGMADLTGMLRYKRFFVGAGVGYWHSSRDDRADLILNAGYMFWGNPDATNLSFFVEGRNAVDEFDDFHKLARLGGGLRLQF